MTFEDEASRDASRSIRHDAPGQAYPSAYPDEEGPLTNDRVGRPADPAPVADGGEGVSSRSTSEEARDLLALRRAKRGEDGAFAALLRANDGSVRVFVTALVGAGSADRVTRDTYVRAYRGLPLAPSTSPRIWLLGIADGACRDAIRRWDRAGGRDRPPGSPPIPLEAPVEQRLAVGLVHGVGLTRREAGRLVEGGVDAVRELLDEYARAGWSYEPDPDAATRSGEPFWNDLGRRLLIERDAPATTFEPDDPGRASELDAESARAPSLQSGRAARGLARREAERNPRAFPWRRVGTAVALLATLGVVLVAVLTTATRASRRDAGLGVTTQKVLTQLDQALARDTAIAGTAVVMTSQDARLPVGRYRIARSSTGSYQIAAATGTSAEGWDVPSSTFVQVSGAEPPSAVVETGLAPGPPEPTAIAPGALGDLLAESVHVVHRGSSGSVETTLVTTPATQPGTAPGTTVPGTPVWVITANLPDSVRADAGRMPGLGFLDGVDADEVRLVADRSLVLPRRLELLRKGRVVLDLSFVDLSISQQTPPTSYAPKVPAGATLTRDDAGFVATGLADLGSEVGYAVSTPSYLPDGYVLAATSANPTTKVAVLNYRNGSLQLTVTVRPRASTPSVDPFTSGSKTTGSSGASAAAREITIRSGALSRRPGWVSTEPVDHVWVDGVRTEVIAAGDPSTDELVKILSSLQ